MKNRRSTWLIPSGVTIKKKKRFFSKGSSRWNPEKMGPLAMMGADLAQFNTKN
jgi:hypothetical protein